MKSIFVFNIQSKSDVITNSSSELFVFSDYNDVSQVSELLDMIYPNWQKDYRLMSLKDGIDKTDYILDYLIDRRDFPDNDFIPQLNHDKTLTLQEYIKKLNNKLSHSKNEKLHKYVVNTPKGLKKIFKYSDRIIEEFLKEPIKRWLYTGDCTYTDEFINDIVEHLFDKGIYLLESYNENPDWQYQKILMNYAKRIHMG